MNNTHSKESYMHLFAKNLLAMWLKDDYLKVAKEEKFYLDGRILFIADIACFDENGIKTLYEVFHKHEIDYKKLACIQYYEYINDIKLEIYEVSAKVILSQIEKPQYIKKFNLSTYK